MTKLHYFIATLQYMDFIESIVVKEELTSIDGWVSASGGN
jgi:hypothetical protein